MLANRKRVSRKCNAEILEVQTAKRYALTTWQKAKAAAMNTATKIRSSSQDGRGHGGVVVAMPGWSWPWRGGRLLIMLWPGSCRGQAGQMLKTNTDKHMLLPCPRRRWSQLPTWRALGGQAASGELGDVGPEGWRASAV